MLQVGCNTADWWIFRKETNKHNTAGENEVIHVWGNMEQWREGAEVGGGSFPN